MLHVCLLSPVTSGFSIVPVPFLRKKDFFPMKTRMITAI